METFCGQLSCTAFESFHYFLSTCYRCVRFYLCTTWQARAFLCLLYLSDGLTEGCPVENLFLCQGQFLPVALLFLAELQDLSAVFLESENTKTTFLSYSQPSKYNFAQLKHFSTIIYLGTFKCSI